MNKSAELFVMNGAVSPTVVSVRGLCSGPIISFQGGVERLLRTAERFCSAWIAARVVGVVYGKRRRSFCLQPASRNPPAGANQGVRSFSRRIKSAGTLKVDFWAALGQNAKTGSLLSASIPVSTRPLPAALPMFAGGLGALGLLKWHRKRKVKVMAAARLAH